MTIIISYTQYSGLNKCPTAAEMPLDHLPALELVKCSDAKEVHLAVVGFLKSLQHIAQCNAQVHITANENQQHT